MRRRLVLWKAKSVSTKGKAFFEKLETCWNKVVHWLVRLLPLLIVSYLVAGICVWWSTSSWSFALKAQTRSLRLDIPAGKETLWNVSGATLCVRGLLRDSAALFKIDDPQQRQQFCRSSRLNAYRIAADHPASDEILAVIGPGLSGSEPDALTQARVSIVDGEQLVVSLEAVGHGGPVVRLRGVNEELAVIDVPVSFHFALSKLAGIKVFPYEASIQIGQDISHSQTETLESGEVEIFKASNEGATGRAVMDKVQLMLGDTIRLGATTRDDALYYPRGFIRIEPATEDDSHLIDVVSYGVSDHLKIERYGDSGFQFKPRIWTRLVHSNILVVWSLFVFGLLSALASLGGAKALLDKKP